jgi:hypothetical protein
MKTSSEKTLHAQTAKASCDTRKHLSDTRREIFAASIADDGSLSIGGTGARRRICRRSSSPPHTGGNERRSLHLSLLWGEL